LIIEILFDLFGNALIELVLEYPFSRYKEQRERKNHHPAIASSGYFLLGGALGACLAWALPRRVLPIMAIPGLSLILSPLGAAFVMEWWGRRRRAGGHPATNLASWYGGAAFALGAALARYLLIR
jgi:hypothetical protein